MNILILHGWGLSGGHYKDLTDLLTQNGHRVLTPDLPGFGQEKAPQSPYHLSDYVAFVISYLKKHKIRKVTIIGHSFGGRIGILLSSTYPSLVHELILTGVPGFKAESSGRIVLFRMIAKAGMRVFSLPGLNRFGESARALLYRAAKTSDYKRTTGVMRETFKIIINEDLAISMRKLTVPTRLIWGKNDTITPVTTAYRMKKCIPNAKLLIIPHAGHSVVYQQPKLFLHFFLRVNS